MRLFSHLAVAPRLKPITCCQNRVFTSYASRMLLHHVAFALFLSSGLDELMRHASSLRVPGAEMLIEILNAIAKLGSSSEESHSSNDSQGCSTPVLSCSSSEVSHSSNDKFVNLMKLLRCLVGLDGIVSVCSSLLKTTTVVISELATSDADGLKELGRVYREIHWQISLCSDIKVDEKQNITVESENAEAAVSTTAGRESDDDVTIPVVRYMNPVSVRNNSHPRWGIGRDFLSVVRSSEGFSRRSRHGLARKRGGRTSRHLETLQMDSEVTANSIEMPSSQDMKKKSPEVLAMEILKKLASTLWCLFVALVKGFTLPNRRRSETGSLGAASKSIGTALAKLFLEAFGFSTYSTSAELSLSVKCRYLGKVVDDMTALVFDNRRHTCYTAMINNFFVHGTFKELLTTFEATSQLLWTLPYALPQSTIQHDNSSEGGKLKI